MNKVLKRTIFAASMLVSPLGLAANKVMLVGIDGVQLEKMQALNLPNFQRLHVSKAYTGGVLGQLNQQSTVSGPGWSTILSGVWSNKHQILDNSCKAANPAYPSVFKRVQEGMPQAKIASIVNWSEPNRCYFKADLNGGILTRSGLSDDAVTDNAVALIEQQYDLVFVHLDEPDGAGHSSGFGSNYNGALARSDGRLGRILDAAEAQTEDNWLVLVTTDHGRQPITGYHHGGQSLSEKTIFIASNQPLNQEFSQPLPTPSNASLDGLYGYPSQASIVPTVLRYLGVDILPSWQLDGTPLLGEMGTRKLLASSDGRIHWSSADITPIDIHRDNQLVASVAGDARTWLDSEFRPGVNHYVLLQNDTPNAISVNRLVIDAALDWRPTRAQYFRSDDQYVAYAKATDRAFSGYPKPVNNQNWKGLESVASLITAAFKKNDGTSYFFLTDGRYINYNNILDKVRDGYPLPINEQTWSGLGAYATEISASLKWNGDKVYFFLNDGRYLRFDLSRDEVDPGYPKPVNNDSWPGMAGLGTKIVAAHKWDNHRAYFFLDDNTYVRYNITEDRSEPDYPAVINQQTWPGLMKVN